MEAALVRSSQVALSGSLPRCVLNYFSVILLHLYLDAFLYYYTTEQDYTASNVPRGGDGGIIPHPET